MTGGSLKAEQAAPCLCSLVKMMIMMTEVTSYLLMPDASIAPIAVIFTGAVDKDSVSMIQFNRKEESPAV